jgi:amidase
VESIEIGDQGVMCTGGGFGVLADRIPELHWRFLPIDEGVARWRDDVEIGTEPMIGVIGVAPAGEPVPCGTPGHHGGNMDTKLITEGAAVYLPVFVPGALLAVGDLHAAMGDGEVAVTGVEVCGRVVLHVDVRRDLRLTDPLVETGELVATIASAETLDEAVDAATHAMAELLHTRLGMELHDAAMFMSAVGDLQISQVVDPLKTARFTMPKAEYETAHGPLL